jgi:hypothetical protein
MSNNEMKVVGNKLLIKVLGEERKLDFDYVDAAIRKLDYDRAYRKARNAKQKYLLDLGKKAELELAARKSK